MLVLCDDRRQVAAVEPWQLCRCVEVEVLAACEAAVAEELDVRVVNAPSVAETAFLRRSGEVRRHHPSAVENALDPRAHRFSAHSRGELFAEAARREVRAQPA